jgi:methyl-accepting chemotaxis protein
MQYIVIKCSWNDFYYNIYDWGIHMRKRSSFVNIPIFTQKKAPKHKLDLLGFLKKIKLPKLGFTKGTGNPKMPKSFKFKKPSFDMKNFNLKNLKSIKLGNLVTGIRGRIILLAVFTIICMIFPIIQSVNSLDANIKKNLRELNMSVNRGIADKVENKIRDGFNSLELVTKSVDILTLDAFEQERAIRKMGEGRFSAVYLVDAQGAMLVTSDATQKGVNASDKLWFKDALRGKEYISDAIPDEKTKQPVVYMSIPILDQYQKPAAVVAGKMELNNIQDLVKDLRVGQQGIAYIVDKNGVVLAHPEYKDKVLTFYNAAQNKIKGAENTVHGVAGATIYNNDKGNEVYGVNSIIPSASWGMITELPVTEAMKPIADATSKITLMSFGALVLAVLGSFILAFMITRPLKNMAKVASEVKNGDLTKRIKVTAKDEIGELQTAFNLMTDSLSGILNEVSAAVEDITEMSSRLSEGVQVSTAATEEITAVVEGVAEGAQSQIKTVNTTSTITKEITDSVVGTSIKTQNVAEAANHAAYIAKEGSENINIINDKIISIKDNVVSSAKQVEKLGSKSEEVTGIVKVIRDIAGKTNMLALNASIEAARAGDAGRGFAVVANEIRSLAEQTREASKNIETLLIEIQTETEYTVTAMNQGLVEVEAGTMAISSTYGTFNKIIEEIQSVAMEINQVSESVLELKTDSERITTSIDEVNEIAETTSLGTQSVLASTEEQASSIQEINDLAIGLSNMAVTLKVLVSKFKV